MSGALKEIWEKVDQMIGPQRMETEAEHIARDMREGRFPERSDPIQVPVAGTEATAIARMGAGDGLVERLLARKGRYGAFKHDVEDGVNVLTHEPAPDPLCQEAAAHIAALTAERDSTCRQLARSDQENNALRERVAKLVEAAEGLSAILDKHETKGPLPDVAMMLCWLAAQNIRAVLRGNILEKPE